jgi:cytochrome c biogenesis protein CcdA/thiol-disulfide isomerase/thioredoxin
MIVLLGFAFLAGLVTILSPCILSIAPILLTAGANHNHHKPLGIITGLIISFSFFTLSFASIVKATGISPDIFRYFALGIIIFFGLTMIIPAFENAFSRVTGRIAQIGILVQEGATHIKREFISGLILGIALGLLWTPCAGPILATIIAIAATEGVTLSTLFVTLAYSIGAAIPMLLFCFGGSKILQSATNLAPYTHTIRKIFGFIVITSALAIAFHIDVTIQEKIAHWFPTITIEQNTMLEKELNMLRKSQGIETMEPAPELVGISTWLNSEPLTLIQLRGKVVLIDFWTYTCINCIRTLPHVQKWYTSYKDYGFEIIGIHTPEFAFEKSEKNVENAIERFGLTYPIALDNDYQTWRAYDNHYWPAHYLINQSGTIVKKQFGEGNYTEMENAIRSLLNMPPLGKKDEFITHKPITPETYLGFERSSGYHPSLNIQNNIPTHYQTIDTLESNQVGLRGTWTVSSDCIQSQDKDGLLELNFIANRVYLVMRAEQPRVMRILLDGKPVPEQYRTKDMDIEGNILVHEPRMYEIINLRDDYGRHTLILQCPNGIYAYVFTFGK